MTDESDYQCSMYFDLWLHDLIMPRNFIRVPTVSCGIY